MDLLLQTAGSLVAILVLAGLARWMKLGGDLRLADEEMVRRAAGEVEDGFTPVAIALTAEAALARDNAGRIMVIKRHGNRFAGRVLGHGAGARLWRDLGKIALEVDSGEPRFGKVFLDIPDAETWADAINRLDEPQNA
jgi:hypothetical protein